MTGTAAGPGPARRASRAAARIAALLLVVAVAGCGGGGGAGGQAPGASAGAAQRGGPTAGVRGGPTAAAGGLTVLSVSFASGAAGWLLGTACAEQVATCRTVLVRRTDDGGRTWSAVPAPDAPPADVFQGSPPPGAVGAILFGGAGRGWAFGPALWQTSDGGAHWRRLAVPDGAAVQDLAVSGNRVLAVTGRCGDGGRACGFRVWSAAAGSDDWRAVPGAAGTAAGPARLVVSGGTGYLLAMAADLGRPQLLAGPVNAGQPQPAGPAAEPGEPGRWRPVPGPCRGAWSGALAAAPGGRLFLGCGLEPGAGQQVKTAWLSADGGRSWRRGASPPDGGYLGAASMDQEGTIVLSGSRMDLYVSTDRGRSWHESPSLRDAAGLAGAGFPLAGGAITGTRAFAFQQGTVWLTSDGGRRWTPVTVR